MTTSKGDEVNSEEVTNAIMQRVYAKEKEIVELTLIINKLTNEINTLKKPTEEKLNGKNNKKD